MKWLASLLFFAGAAPLTGGFTLEPPNAVRAVYGAANGSGPSSSAAYANALSGVPAGASVYNHSALRLSVNPPQWRCTLFWRKN